MTTIAQQTGSGTAAVRPFPHVNVPESELDDLRRRVKAMRWPTKELVADQSQGVQLATMQALASYWATEYDWRKVEARLNAIPQFVTEIDGQDIQFIHVRSKHENALPLIITHGWPGSIIEQMKVIGPLTDPTAHGASASDAFHLVIPSIPGYGYSPEPTTLGWDPIRIAKAWVALMKRLGYNQFVAQGGDWGASITQQLALFAPENVLGIHSNMPGTVPADTLAKAIANAPPPAGLAGDELQAYRQLADFYTHHLGYAVEMSNRPETLYGLMDSPVGLAAWILDHDKDSYEMIAPAFFGHPGGLSRDDVLDNITMYWLTKTAISSARLYWENKLGFFNVVGVTIPVGVSAFPHEIYTAPRSWAEKAYPKLVFYKKHEVGGHFAAWEQPQLFSEDVRATFRSVRTS
ncbi:MAG TPA: epoxide hydrolase [Candidatus Acidoferrales bacterium]|jgi:pimeloyl-ACP methyl ester carboxylesterase|nr:epoxide hydrolase [Candidatus Acidoferrales bacterium]